MTFQVSPGVQIREIDLTGIIPSASSAIGAFVGNFAWGPVDEITTLSSEVELRNKFGYPNATATVDFHTAAYFLKYAGSLKTLRVIDELAKNANTDDTSTTVLVKNNNDYANQIFASIKTVNVGSLISSGATTLTLAAADPDNDIAGASDLTVGDTITGTGIPAGTTITAIDGNDVDISAATTADIDGTTTSVALTVNVNYGEFIAKYPGAIGDTLRVEVCSNAAAFDVWAYKKYFTGAPGTSDYAAARGGSNDELHVIVLDQDGELTGTAGSVLEIFQFLSQASDAKTNDGATNYYANVLNNTSQYVWFANHGVLLSNAGTAAKNTNFATATPVSTTALNAANGYTITLVDASDVVLNSGITGHAAIQAGSVITDITGNVITLSKKLIADIDGSGTAVTLYTGIVDGYAFSGGADSGDLGATSSVDEIVNGFDYFAEPTNVDVAFLIMPRVESVTGNHTVVEHLISIAESRKDCIALCSPPVKYTTQSLTPAADVISWAAGAVDRGSDNHPAITSSSYAVLDSTALKVYDKYNDQYIWIPASSTVAGLCAATDLSNDPWWSPAGFNRGNLLGLTAIGFNPTRAERDDMFQARINPIVSFPGDGVILYGDKTAQSKPSAFDRINVRRLFIVLEKAISRAAKYSLFEFNDEFTRNQFVNMVNPYLRDVKARRGIFDFYIVCNEVNNTEEVIDRNEFVADIFIKPARAISYMTLNFVATRTGATFSEITGAV